MNAKHIFAAPTVRELTNRRELATRFEEMERQAERDEGEKIGRHKALLETTKKLLARRASPEEVAALVGFPLAELVRAH